MSYKDQLRKKEAELEVAMAKAKAAYAHADAIRIEIDGLRCKAHVKDIGGGQWLYCTLHKGHPGLHENTATGIIREVTR
ncbi:hypothetical protein [Nesterenkonia flava]|uniref:HNH endonuclease n=1 Tax=Nesterenkonia flava TaxID=469799 RepID=A0ABU1FW90_9MICC|nr:hypothetical protein [Nesterenkonia flava]MDR5712954.1 hypothetical protein [Nesterenkonia flava]